jgi:hypothetical protein
MRRRDPTTWLPHDAVGKATLRVFSCRVSPDAHALEVVSVAENRNVPAVDADHTAMSVIVSEVPPFVHCGVLPMDVEPAEAAPKVTESRVVDPTDTLVVPAVPGSAVWSSTKTLVYRVGAVLFRTFSSAFANVDEKPSAIGVVLFFLVFGFGCRGLYHNGFGRDLDGELDSHCLP